VLCGSATGLGAFFIGARLIFGVFCLWTAVLLVVAAILLKRRNGVAGL
jgi:hypothetical protein